MPYQVDVNGEFRKIGLDYVTMDRAPTGADNSYTAPFGWLDSSANEWFILVDVTAGVATWESAGGPGTGDVTGPGSATDNAVARFDGTSGKLIQNSGVTIDDNAITTFGGGVNLDRSSTAISVNSAGETIVTVTDTSAPRTITLATSDVVDGRVIFVSDGSGGAASNNITVDTQGAETINGAASFTISTNYGSMGFYSDGTNWFTLVPSGGAGGLTYFTESEDSGTQITDSLTANGTNANFGIIPNGTGAIVADIPDGTSTGGNARGTSAVDLQMTRSAATHVAAGNNSAIVSGNNNRAAGANSGVVAGTSNTVNTQYGFVGGGATNTLNSTKGDANACIGGRTNTVAGDSAVCIGGFSGTVDEDYAVTVGGIGNRALTYASVVMGDRGASNIFSQVVYAGGRFASPGGDSQGSMVVARCLTTNATPTNFLIGGASFAAATDRIVVPSNRCYNFNLQIVAVDVSAGDMAWWNISGGIKNIGGTTSLVGTNVVQNDADAGASTWAISVTADNTNDALNIAATGQAAKTIRWTATTHLAEVAF